MIPWTLMPPPHIRNQENSADGIFVDCCWCWPWFRETWCLKTERTKRSHTVTVVWNAFSDIKFFVIRCVCWTRLLLPLPPPLHPNIPTLSIQLTHISFGTDFSGRCSSQRTTRKSRRRSSASRLFSAACSCVAFAYPNVAREVCVALRFSFLCLYLRSRMQSCYLCFAAYRPHTIYIFCFFFSKINTNCQ